jgi:hypothetical protein|tara:strand:+ start:149 stop:601 length:453 start_codon:yes stop_codon:yes gene_type:complete
MNGLISVNTSTVQFDQENYEFFRQTLSMTFPIGTTSLTVRNKLNEEYIECVGIAVYDVSATDIVPRWALALDYENGKTIQQATTGLDWLSGTIAAGRNGNFSEAYKPMKFNIKGGLQNIKHTYISDEATTAIIKLDVVYLLRRPMNTPTI